MGTLLTFQIPPRDPKPASPEAGMGKLLLFTGVRYERNEKDDTPKPSAKGVRSRRRN